MKMRISSFVFPISFYLIDGNNDSLVIDDTAYTLTHGNYTAKNLATHILTLIPSNYTMTYDSITNKFTITNSSADFTINSTSTCLTLLGFTEDEDHTSTSSSITSDNVVNLSGQYNVVYVDIKNLLTNNISSATGRRTSIVSAIPVSVNYGAVMYFEDSVGSYMGLQEDSISYLHVRILAEDMSSLVDFQGQDWNMTIEFSFDPAENDYRTFQQMIGTA